MADDAKPSIPVQVGRSKDFRNVFSNTFRFRAGPTEIGVAFGYATQVPMPNGQERAIIQDEVELIFTPSTLKLLKIAIDDNLEAIEKIIGTIQLPQEVLDGLAEQKAKANAALESESQQK